MRKAWLYERPGRPGVYVHWYGDDGRQHSKRLPNKTTAEQYRKRLEHQMNNELYSDPVPLQLDDLIAEYVAYKKNVKRLAPNSITSIEDALRNFRRFCGPKASTRIDERLIGRYVTDRRDKGRAAATVNKDLRQLRAFVRWAVKQKYMGKDAQTIDWGDLRQKEPKRPVRTLSIPEFAAILKSARELYGSPWYIRVMLAVATGLRQQDIERLAIGDVHLESCTLTTRSRKTGKSSGNRPFHPLAARVLSDYMGSIPSDQQRLFPDAYDHTKWDRIQKHAQVTVKYHELRKTFASFILQAGFSTSVVQDLLEHSTPNLTHDVYANLAPVYRQAVNAIPLDQIISPSGSQEQGPVVPTQEHPSADSEPRCPS